MLNYPDLQDIPRKNMEQYSARKLQDGLSIIDIIRTMGHGCQDFADSNLLNRGCPFSGAKLGSIASHPGDT